MLGERRAWMALLLLSAFICTLLPAALAAADPVADPGSIVTFGGNARFTVLTPQMIRMEWAEDGQFEDRATVAFINRKLPVPDFKVSADEKTLTIQTSSVTLSYTNATASSRFSADNLQITFQLNGVPVTWYPGLENVGNLHGTIRTLDGQAGAVNLNCSALTDSADLHCTEAIISRNGWAVVDDSAWPVMAEYSDLGIPWPTNRPSGDRLDMYMFAYGLQYRKAMADFTLVSGKLPMIPRYALDNWHSRYWAYSDTQIRDLLDQYTAHQVPLGVYVLDMDWHITFYKEAAAGQKDQAGLTPGWTGYTPDPNLFPDFGAFLEYIKSLGLRFTFNQHPASGIQPHESMYADFATAMGIDPSTKKYVPFAPLDTAYIKNLFDLIFTPYQQMGLDFVWNDWQQGEEWLESQIPLPYNPTILLNYIFHQVPAAFPDGKRPMVFHRWGGLGNHRFPIGFSGDVVPTWEALQFQPYFTATAANVLFGYWSHDLGGHTQPSPPELYTRWMQWGIFSPIVRSHCTKQPDNDRRIWTYPLENFSIMRDALVIRRSLVPYIYSEVRRAYDTSVPFLRAMYIDYPSAPEAYEYQTQYIFGDEMVVSPIVTPVDVDSQMAEKEIWLPSGQWIEMFSGRQFQGPITFSANYTLSEIPAFVRAGSIIPMAHPFKDGLFGGAEKNPSHLIVSIFAHPNVAGGAYSMYEDASDDTAFYTAGEYTFISMRYEYLASTGEFFITISPPAGSYQGLPVSRTVEVRIIGSYPAAIVSLNSEELPFKNSWQTKASSGQQTGWSFDGAMSAVHIHIPSQPSNSPVSLHVRLSKPLDNALNGAPLKMQRLRAVKDLLDQEWNQIAGGCFQEDYEAVVLGSQASQRLSDSPALSLSLVATLDSALAAAASQVAAMSQLPSQVQIQAQALLSVRTSAPTPTTPHENQLRLDL